MTKIHLPYHWKPRAYQENVWRALHDPDIRAVAACWHRRSGKDAIGMNWAACHAHERIGNIWHFAPEATQARRAFWDAVDPHTGQKRIDQAFPREIRSNTRGNDMTIEFACGSSWQVLGSDNYDSLVGATPVAVIWSEWALADPRARAYIRPILLENKGKEFFAYTSRGDNHGRTLFEELQDRSDSFAERLTAHQTDVFTEAELADERKRLIAEYGAELGEAFFAQEYECAFDTPIMGAYYGREMMHAEKADRITRVPYESRYPCVTAWDIGIDDATAIWVAQQVGRERRILAYYEATDQPPDHYVEWLHSQPYRYETHYLPHDAGAREMSGHSYEDMLRDGGLRGVTKVGTHPNKTGGLLGGIQTTRQTLSSCYWDAKGCERGLLALRNYAREWDEKKKAYKPTPLHNWASHGADAFRVLCTHWRPRVMTIDQSKLVQPQQAVV